MTPYNDAVVYVVDDDAVVRDALAWLLRSRRLLADCYDSADAFSAMLQSRGMPLQPACLLLDMRMPGMSGLALFDQLVGAGLHVALPVIFLTGHADVPTAVEVVKQGAFDFVEKPFSDNQLVDRVEQALDASRACLAQHEAERRLQSQLAELTEREAGVLRLVVEGLSNKLIADQLDISVRTVEVHRARVFDKMGVRSAVELVNLLGARGLARSPAR